ncbi:Gfo/Idh/MocA family oxidoreductase, partial [Bosea sp. (in: a-proteobacteria)]|uniref:Gfo/Idh/MocA family protein n=1 Tax=Bosea sp. (in: a-proteobacteria) TaxID=1871050 RepID=UPI0025C2A6BF
VGEIVAVGAVLSNRRRGFPVEDTAGVLLEFENGAIGTIFVSDSAVSPWTTEQGVGEAPEHPYSGESNYRFMGSRGALEFPNLVQWVQAGEAPSWNLPIQAQRIHAPTLDPYVAQLDHFRDLVRGEVASLQPVEDGARTLIATLAVAEAAASGRWIDLRECYAAVLPPA